jgi:2-polyprenyl-3-methyl-5-hydroxy-6-metoxy-1,4-benzoquinol methylase
MERASTNCILCGSPGREPLIRQGEWTVHRCKGCGLGVLDPHPDQRELDDLYQNSYLEDLYGAGLKVGSPGMKRRLSQETHRIRFFRRAKRSGRLLDIGCGMGYFLAACRNWGYEVEGMDISADSAAYVRDHLKIPVAVGTVDGIDYPPASFDVITMWHFLEHAPDPRLYLQKTQKWLKPSGLLVVDVPNYTATDARYAWQKWKGWHLPFHLYHFTPETLCGLLAKQGFRTIRRKSYLSEAVKERLERILVPKPIARLVARCYSGHSYAVVTRKNGKI